MKRAKHNLSHYKLSTMDMGRLVPVSCVEVLPGDTFQGHTSALVRVSPLVAPVMHPVTVRLHSWFVPYRQIWDGWEDFITGGSDGQGGSAGAFPYIQAPPSTGFSKGGLADHLGIPPGVPDLQISALPFRAYFHIYQEFYRDQDLIPEVALETGSGLDTLTPVNLKTISWEKDYFTMSRPWPQKGPEVLLPLGSRAPIKTDQAPGAVLGVRDSADVLKDLAAGAASLTLGSTTIGSPADLFADLEGATAASINDIRRAAALQRYQEMRAMYGSRYTEYLRLLGVKSSDARLQRPEYLGGGKQTISFSEVLRTGSETAPVDPAAAPIGEMKGHGIAALRQNRWRRFFEEHGVVITLMSVRPRTMYGNHLSRMWSRRTKEDFWQRELENIGHQEVYRREVYAEASPGGDTLFGYADRYAEYRHEQSSLAGDFRDTLNFWHLGRIFASPPALNQSFVQCDPSKRIHAVQTEDVLWCMINNNLVARRLVAAKVNYRIF